MGKNREKTEKILKKKLEAMNGIALLHSYRQSIAFEKKSIKELKKYVSPDEMRKIEKHLKDAEKVLNELMNDILDAVFKSMECFKTKELYKNPLPRINDVGNISLGAKEKLPPGSSTHILKIRIGDSAVYGFPKKLSKHLSKDDWSPFYEYLNKAALQVVKNQIKGHEKNGDKKYLPFEIMIVAQYQVSGNLDQIHYPLVAIPFSKDGVNVQKEIL